MFVTLLLVIAIWRATRLLVVDEWPPTRWLRDWICDHLADVDMSGKLVRRRGVLGPLGFTVAYLWTCQWCMSVWVGGGLVWAAVQWVSVPAPWLVVAAGSCLAGVMAMVEAEHDQRWEARDQAARDREQQR